MVKHMLTTTDNPFSPVTQYDAWYAYDATLGHHTPAYLARIVRTSAELSQADQDLAVEQAIDEILKYNVNGLYTRVEVPA